MSYLVGDGNSSFMRSYQAIWHFLGLDFSDSKRHLPGFKGIPITGVLEASIHNSPSSGKSSGA